MDIVALIIAVTALGLSLYFVYRAHRAERQREIDLTDDAMRKQLAHYEIRLRSPEANR